MQASGTEVLRRIPGSRFSEILTGWLCARVAIIGGGPSVTPEGVDLVARAHAAGRVRVVAVNDAYLLAPFADLHYAADAHWHRWHAEGIPRIGLEPAEVAARWRAFAGAKATIENSGGKRAGDDVHVLRNLRGEDHAFGLSRNSQALITGRNSGFQALNLAVLAGAAEIVLLGFDGAPVAGKTHWHGGHPRVVDAQVWPYIRQSFSAVENDLAAIGVRVWNTSATSAIASFPFRHLADALG